MEENLNEEEREKLRLENEIRKIKLELEKGAKFFESSDMPALPPEIENEFLNYIEQFEKISESSSKITVYEKLGKPPIINISDYTDDELSVELDDLFEQLNDHDIYVNSTHEVEDAEMYRFITEDIFKQELFAIDTMEGVITHFNYEEFYPDDIKDIIACIDDFVERLLNLSDPDILFEENVLDMNTTNKWLYDFREAYAQFDFHRMNVYEVQVSEADEKTATAVFDISFDAYTEGRTEIHHYEGKGTAELLLLTIGWMLEKVSLPKPI